MTIAYFNVRDLAISLSGIPLDAGFADDDVLEVEWDGELWDFYQGADGDVTRTPTHNLMATVTLRVQQTSPVNDRLSALVQADLLSPNGAAAGVFMCRDTNGRTVITSEQACALQFAPFKAGKGTKVNEWKIKLINARGSFIGGN